MDSVVFGFQEIKVSHTRGNMAGIINQGLA